MEDQRQFELSSAQLQAIFDNAGVGVIVVGPDKKFVLVNGTFERLSGYTFEELREKTFIDITHPDDVDLSANYFKDTLTQKESQYQHVKRYVRKDGSIFWIRLTAAKILKKDDQIHSVAIVEDITAQKDAEHLVKEQQIKMQIIALENAHSAGMSEIATGVLHNIGNILNSVNINVETILRTLNKSQMSNLLKANELLSKNLDSLADFLTHSPKGKLLPQFYLDLGNAWKGEFDSINAETKELVNRIQLIKDVISSQQVYAKGADFREEVFLEEMVDTALSMQGVSLTRHDIHIERKYSEIGPVLVQKSKLIHILINLIKNAKEAMLKKVLDKKLLILEIGKNQSDKRPFIKVTDNGEGISQENLKKIFNHGFTTKSTGHGFGLHSCANAMTEMGGELVAHSDGLGQGAAFTIYFSEKK